MRGHDKPGGQLRRYRAQEDGADAPRLDLRPERNSTADVNPKPLDSCEDNIRHVSADDSVSHMRNDSCPARRASALHAAAR